MKITREEVTIEILELLLNLRSILDHGAAKYYIENPTKMLPSLQVRYKRICAYFKYLNIEIKDLKYFYDLDFIENFKEYKFSDEIIETVKQAMKGFYTIEDIKNENLKEIISRVIYFRTSYINILEGFFGGMRIMGVPPVEERVSKAFIIESIQDIDTVVERLNKIITCLLFPQIKEFDLNVLTNEFNFPQEDYKALDKQEWEDYYDGI